MDDTRMWNMKLVLTIAEFLIIIHSSYFWFVSRKKNSFASFQPIL